MRRGELRDMPKKKERTKRDIYLRSTYRITEKQYNSRLKNQEGGCKICKRRPSKGKYLSVDHCHKTGKVRGLLCSRCNLSLGVIESPMLEAFLNYLRAGRSRKPRSGGVGLRDRKPLKPK